MSLDFIEDLETVMPQPRLVTTAIGDIAVGPLTTAQLPAFLRLTQGLFAELNGKPLPEFQGSAANGQALGDIDWIGLLATHGDQLIRAVALVVDKPATDIGRLPLDHTVALIQAILEENADFFFRRLLPATSGLLTGMLVKFHELSGRTSFNDSSNTDTAAPTS